MDRPEDHPTAHEQTHLGLLSRTWELELLISGALVFALMQVPGHLDRYWDHVIFDVGRTGFSLVMLLHIYVRAMVAILILAFLLNLGARAYWVGLVGLDSVFPQGIRWDRAKLGPMSRDFYRTRVPETRRMIDLLDNFCSVTFSFAFVMVVIFLMAGVLAVLTVGLVYLLARAIGAEHRVSDILAVVLITVALALSVFTLVDRRYGERLEGTRTGAVLRRAIGWVSILQVVPLYGTTFMTLVTNLRARVAVPLIYAVMFGVILYVFSDLAAENLEVTGERYVPANVAAVGVSYDHYQSHRSPDSRIRDVPVIQSDIIQEPYVRLFIPYVARRDAQAIEQLCPNATPLVDGLLTLRPDLAEVPAEEDMRIVLDCISGYRYVRLNDVAVTQPHRFYREPRQGVEGTVVYIPVGDLPAGEHMITVNRTPRWDGAGPDAVQRDAYPPYRIPFWR